MENEAPFDAFGGLMDATPQPAMGILGDITSNTNTMPIHAKIIKAGRQCSVWLWRHLVLTPSHLQPPILHLRQ
jgi:hypothetical protein